LGSQAEGQCGHHAVKLELVIEELTHIIGLSGLDYIETRNQETDPKPCEKCNSRIVEFFYVVGIPLTYPNDNADNL